MTKIKGYKKPFALAPNVIKSFKNFIVSYNKGLNETALLPKGEGYFFILTGDFREIYEELDLKQALQKFIELSDQYLNGWSDTTERAKEILKGLIK